MQWEPHKGAPAPPPFLVNESREEKYRNFVLVWMPALLPGCLPRQQCAAEEGEEMAALLHGVIVALVYPSLHSLTHTHMYLHLYTGTHTDVHPQLHSSIHAKPSAEINPLATWYKPMGAWAMMHITMRANVCTNMPGQ